ncbi:hypothetical protein [Streptomyces sp. NBC_01451]|uniref:hypothetical protein n=1 Tax=Streptomyces sp. NBC_01451 TaxID=2903872 RepID=UPI002E344B21|nr:hypothetical protein [Streptomyces sp. NBC_01451]
MLNALYDLGIDSGGDAFSVSGPMPWRATGGSHGGPLGDAYAVDAPGAGSHVLIASAEGFQSQSQSSAVVVVVVVGDEPVSYGILLQY